MTPPTHFLLSWLVANIRAVSRRDTLLIVLAGLSPDIDGLGVLINSNFYVNYHHLLTHNIFSAVIAAILIALFSRKRFACFVLSLSAIHVHYLADYLGAGPRWPLYYLYPLSREAWLFKYQWNLGSWQEQLIALLSIIASIFIARKRRWTIVGLFSKKADNRVMEVIDRFPCRKVNR